MGFNVSYLASRYSMAELAQIYQIELSSESTEIPQGDKPWIAELSNGWTIWWLEDPDGFNLQRINPHRACPQGEACYTVSVAEFCMHSSLAKFIASSKRWSVTHHGDHDDPEHLKITGKPPKIFAKLRHEVFAEQRNQTISPADGQSVPNDLKAIADSLGATIAPFGSGMADYVFDLPVRLGQHFFDFRYDQLPKPGMVIRCSEVLGAKTSPERKPSLWQRILRR